MYIDVTDNDRKKINGLSNSKLGSAIRIDDISPVTHEMSVKISSDTVTDLTAVKVTRCGKNLIPLPYSQLPIGTTTLNGIEFTVYEDGSILMNGTATTSFARYLYSNKQDLLGLRAGDIITGSKWVSDDSQKANFNVTFNYYNIDGDMKEGVINLGAHHQNLTTTITEDYVGWGIYIYISSGKTFDNLLIKPQLELGKTATDYEPYVEPTEYTPNADGIVNGVTSLYPNTTLMTDTDGVIIDCEYLTKLYTEVFDSANIKNGSSIGSLRTIGSKEEDSSYTLGQYSVAEGCATKASGYSSHAEGYGTEASSNYSHAEGLYASASGYGSHAEGYHTKALRDYSHAEGHYASASGYGSHAEGCYATASGEGSHAEGEGTKISSRAAHAQGRYNIVDNNDYADIIGNGTSDTERSNAYTMDWNGNAWFAGDVYVGSTSGKNKDEGSKKLTTNLIDGSSIGSLRTIGSKEEDSSYKLGKYSIAEGYSTKASGDCSHAEGDVTEASGKYSHAEGSYTIASGYQSHAEGSCTTASGTNSHAEGSNTRASGDYSHAEGFYTTASGNYSHAEGLYTIASGNYSHAQGQYNISDPAYADVIGNGTTITNRSNAYTMDWKGNAWFAGDIYVGSKSGKNKDEESKKVATIEEGTWTPMLYTVNSGAAAVQPTYTVKRASGTYYRIGDLVYVNCDSVFIVTDGGTGWANIKGLPFVSKDNASMAVSEACGGLTYGENSNYVSQDDSSTILLDQGKTFARIRCGNGIVSSKFKSGYGSGGEYENYLWIKFSGVYRIA